MLVYIIVLLSGSMFLFLFYKAQITDLSFSQLKNDSRIESATSWPHIKAHFLKIRCYIQSLKSHSVQDVTLSIVYPDEEKLPPQKCTTVLSKASCVTAFEYGKVKAARSLCFLNH